MWDPPLTSPSSLLLISQGPSWTVTALPQKVPIAGLGDVLPSEPESFSLRPWPVRDKKELGPPKESLQSHPIRRELESEKEACPAQSTLLAQDHLNPAPLLEGAPHQDSTHAPPHPRPWRRVRHPQLAGWLAKPSAIINGLQGSARVSRASSAHLLHSPSWAWWRQRQRSWQSLARSCRAALNTQYTRLGLRVLRARIGSLASVRATARLPANGPRLHKPHPGKSRPGCTARSFMWPGFRAAPALAPASLPAASLAPPNPALPWRATPATWGSDWALVPQGGHPPPTQTHPALSHSLHSA